MGLPKQYEPAPESWMTMTNPRFTICEVLREIYTSSDFNDIRFKCRVAVHMAKRMDAKLREYNKEWNSSEWNGNTEEMRKTLEENIPDREGKQNERMVVGMEKL